MHRTQAAACMQYATHVHLPPGTEGATTSALPPDAAHTPFHDHHLHQSSSQPLSGDEIPDGLAAEGEAAFVPDYLSPCPSHHEHVSPPMDPIAEEGNRPSISGTIPAAQAAPGATSSGSGTRGARPLESGAVGQGRCSGGDGHAHGCITGRMHGSDTGEAAWEEHSSEGGFGHRAGARSSAPTPSTLAAAAAAAAVAAAGGPHAHNPRASKPLLQRLSESFRAPGSHSPSPHRLPSPSGESGSGAGFGASHAERTSLMTMMGTALRRVSASFRPGEELASQASQPVTARAGGGGGGGGKGGSSARPLASSSTPVVQAYSSDRHSAGPPNLRRRGCYAGLIGSHRTHTMLQGMVTSPGTAGGGAQWYWGGCSSEGRQWRQGQGQRCGVDGGGGEAA